MTRRAPMPSLKRQSGWPAPLRRSSVKSPKTPLWAGWPCRRAPSSLFSLLSANRDESVFPDSDHLPPDRPPVQRHIAFGQGVHACIGNSLARMEARPVVRAIAPATRNTSQ